MTFCRRLCFILVLLCFTLAVNGLADKARLEVPEGGVILPNGRFAEGEWPDAAKVSLDESTELLCKTSGDYLLLGLRFLGDKHTGVDLYLADDSGGCRMLHVSSALGERWKDSTGWNNIDFCENHLWVANSIGSVTIDGKTQFVAPDGFEFQIDRRMLAGRSWRLMVHLKRPTAILPDSADADNPAGWLVLELGE